jgi:hypothetical protein
MALGTGHRLKRPEPSETRTPALSPSECCKAFWPLESSASPYAFETTLDTLVVVLQSHLKRPSNQRCAIGDPSLSLLVPVALKPIYAVGREVGGISFKR